MVVAGLPAGLLGAAAGILRLARVRAGLLLGDRNRGVLGILLRARRLAPPSREGCARQPLPARAPGADEVAARSGAPQECPVSLHGIAPAFRSASGRPWRRSGKARRPARYARRTAAGAKRRAADTHGARRAEPASRAVYAAAGRSLDRTQ